MIALPPKKSILLAVPHPFPVLFSPAGGVHPGLSTSTVPKRPVSTVAPSTTAPMSMWGPSSAESVVVAAADDDDEKNEENDIFFFF